MISRLYRFFWGVYGQFAWDMVNQTIKEKLVRIIVDILKIKQSQEHEKVLDAGCGTGNYAIALATAGFQVTGIDYSPGMLKCAKSKVTNALAENLSFQQMDMNSSLTFPDSTFDHVISMSTLWTVNDPLFTLTEFARILKPNGTLIILQVIKSEGITSTLRNRIRHLSNKSFAIIALVAFKSVLDRTRMTKYWTPLELLSLVLSTKEFAISSVDHGPPVVIIASRV